MTLWWSLAVPERFHRALWPRLCPSLWVSVHLPKARSPLSLDNLLMCYLMTAFGPLLYHGGVQVPCRSRLQPETDMPYSASPVSLLWQLTLLCDEVLAAAAPAAVLRAMPSSGGAVWEGAHHQAPLRASAPTSRVHLGLTSPSHLTRWGPDWEELKALTATEESVFSQTKPGAPRWVPSLAGGCWWAPRTPSSGSWGAL